MRRRELLPPARLHDLLLHYALGEMPVGLAPRFDLSPAQVNGLIWTHKKRFFAICATLGVEPPRRPYPKGGAKTLRPKVYGRSDQTIPRPPSRTSAQAKVRPCLKCRQSFYSEGFGQRLCPGCATTRRYDGGEAYSVATSGRRGAPGAQ